MSGSSKGGNGCRCSSSDYDTCTGIPCDCEEWISVVYDWAPGVKEAQKPQGIVLGILNELMKAQELGYALYHSIKEGFEKIDDIIAEAVKKQQNSAWLFAEKYYEEPNLYIMASGASYSQAYGFAICSLAGDAVDGLRISQFSRIFPWTF
ncbi:MAG: hypothetical protein ACLRP0_17775 [Blautia wexlerae]